MSSQIPSDQLLNDWGNLSVLPVAGVAEGDIVKIDGAGVDPAGVYWYHSGAWTMISTSGTGVDTQDTGTAVDTPAATINFEDGLAAAGGAGTTTVRRRVFETPASHKEVMPLSDTACNGHSGQRSVTVLADGKKLILWQDATINTLFLTVINRSYRHMDYDGIEQNSRTYALAMQEYITLTGLTAEDQDFCITSEVGGADGEMVHITFTAITATGPDIFDVYFPSTEIPDVDAPGVLATLNVAVPYGDGAGNIFGEKVNQVTLLTQDCKQPTTAANPMLPAGPGIVVVYAMEAAAHGVYQVWANFYDPTLVPGVRYSLGGGAYVELLASDPLMVASDAHYPTVEIDASLIHVAYTNSDANPDDLYYSNTTVAGIAPGVFDGVLPLATPITSFGALGGTFASVGPTMVLIDNQDAVRNEIVIGIFDTVGQHYHVYNFDDGIVGAPPVVFNEDAADLTDTLQQDNDVRYQLGCSQTQYDTGNNLHPILYLYHTQFMLAAGTNGMYMLMLRDYDDLGDNTIAWKRIPLSSTGFPVVVDPMFHCKVQYSFQYNQQGTQVGVEPYYPFNVFFRMIAVSDGAGGLAPQDMLIASDYINY